MILSKLTSNARTTIPQAVRNALRLRDGDEIVYVIADDHVVITKAGLAPAHDTFVTFEEWDSEADQRAFAKL